MAIAGRVAIVPKGDWSADAIYKRLDAVTYNNTLYFAKKDVPAGTVTSNTEYWSKSIVGGAGGVATADEAGVVKPADGLTVAEDGTLKVNIDGTTLTMDQVNNVIKLADTLKDAINGAFPAANVANNQITTVEGFALDARQANPNIDGSLAKQISDLNGSINQIDKGINGFDSLDHDLKEGEMRSIRVSYNREFKKIPVVVACWNTTEYIFEYHEILAITSVDTQGFTVSTVNKVKDRYGWRFTWIAVEQ